MGTELRQLQIKILELVEYFDDFCRKHNIEYYLMGGTALGAVRHKGFIPWDDDFDVFMNKENYTKFRSIVKSRLDKKRYYFQEENSSENPLPFCKLRMNNTALIEIDTQSRIMHQGIFLDIMPLCNASDSLFFRYMQYFFSRLLIARALGEKGYVTGSLLKRVVIFLAKFIILSGLQSKLSSIIESSNRKETKMTGFFFGRTKYKNMFFPQKFLKEMKRLDFEKFSLPVFEKVEEYLKITFGNDFMRTPTKKERDKYPQHTFLFDVNKSYKYYLNGLENWRKYNDTIIPNTPPHIKIENSIHSIKKYIKSNNVWFARWTTDFDCKTETNFWYIIKDSFQGMDEYSSNTRKSIRKGLKNIDVRLVSKNKVIQEGYEVYKQAFIRYNTHVTMKKKHEFVEELLDLNDLWDFWGAFNKEGVLVGFSVNKVEDQSCNLSATKFHPDYLKSRISDVFFYKMTDYYLNILKVKYITGGTRSLSHNTNIQKEYIRKFNYRKAYCKMNIIYSPFVAVAIKFIYPFRFVIKNLNNKFTSKLQVLIRHEEIRKSFL